MHGCIKGKYNRKRKEISISPRLSTPLRLYVLFHECLHYLLDKTILSKTPNRFLHYITYGHKYFSSFQEFRKSRKCDVLFRIADVEFDKLRLELSEIRDGRVVFCLGRGLFEREFEEVRKRFNYVWFLRKEAIHLLKTRIKELEKFGNRKR